MNNDLISREALKKAIDDYAENRQDTLLWQADVEEIIDNAPTVEPCYQTTSCLDCDNYDKENHNCPRYCEVIKEAINSRPQGEWIPVSERLPEVSDFYLVTMANKDTTYVTPLFFMKSTPDMWEHDKRIIAWQPLPKPYKSEAEELYNQAAVEYTEYCERYEPTYNPDDGSM